MVKNHIRYKIFKKCVKRSVDLKTFIFDVSTQSLVIIRNGQVCTVQDRTTKLGKLRGTEVMQQKNLNHETIPNPPHLII